MTPEQLAPKRVNDEAAKKVDGTICREAINKLRAVAAEKAITKVVVPYLEEVKVAISFLWRKAN
jgi:hypothetical protein